ncbi:hypothetical protein [Sphingobacterium faecium]|uniref:hypothetical protein n=1 Tax=Sphingobacterium faecium TaxID=34087 RepID=UPI003DA2C407
MSNLTWVFQPKRSTVYNGTGISAWPNAPETNAITAMWMWSVCEIVTVDSAT